MSGDIVLSLRAHFKQRRDTNHQQRGDGKQLNVHRLLPQEVPLEHMPVVAHHAARKQDACDCEHGYQHRIERPLRARSVLPAPGDGRRYYAAIIIMKAMRITQTARRVQPMAEELRTP